MIILNDCFLCLVKADRVVTTSVMDSTLQLHFTNISYSLSEKYGHLENRFSSVIDNGFNITL